MGRAIELTSSADPADVPSRLPSGWRPRAYRLQTRALHLTRKYRELAPGLAVQEVRLLSGAIRIDGQIAPGLLRIGFVNTKEIRILGNCISDAVMAIGCGGSRLNFAANFPGSALTLHFSPAMARRVVPERLQPRLLQCLQGPLGLEALLHPMTQTGRVLEEAMRRLLSPAERGLGDADHPLPSLALDQEELIKFSADLVNEILAAEIVVANPGARRRRELALAVESFLWETPPIGGGQRLSLDDAASRLRCSRRSIQLALHEEFGLGFVALKRSIRLQQVHAILRRRPHSVSGIGRIAMAHEFNHLSRFAIHYREMFGVLPSLELAGGAGSPV